MLILTAKIIQKKQMPSFDNYSGTLFSTTAYTAIQSSLPKLKKFIIENNAGYKYYKVQNKSY